MFEVAISEIVLLFFFRFAYLFVLACALRNVKNKPSLELSRSVMV